MELYKAEETGLRLMMLGCDIDSQHTFLNLLSGTELGQEAPITDYLVIKPSEKDLAESAAENEI